MVHWPNLRGLSFEEAVLNAGLSDQLHTLLRQMESLRNLLLAFVPSQQPDDFHRRGTQLARKFDPMYFAHSYHCPRRYVVPNRKLFHD
jgi:hypothetical protein